MTLAGAFGWSGATILLTRTREAPPETVTLRIGHWQLEGGVRDAFNAMAAEYQTLHPHIRIVQDAIPEGLYGQWMTTQMMGATAPDMLEIGMLPGPIMLSYERRYFLSLTSLVNQPNPYNLQDPTLRENEEGRRFARLPLRLTYKDAMRNSYVDEMQEYMSIPLSQFGQRVFFNRDLLSRLTGSGEPPRDYAAFLAACEVIERQRLPDGQRYVPIVGSRYHLAMWESMMADILTFPALQMADFNRDGFLSSDEFYVAIRSGRLRMDDPAFRARFAMLGQIISHMQPGFTGLTRDEGVFLFAQQKAVFITTGTWDARSLMEQAQGKFRVGLMDFPRPTPDDPVYGPFMRGPAYERPSGTFCFGVTRFSRHPREAMDFLLFLASRRRNEELNRIIGWIPAIRGAQVDETLRGFIPNLEGVYPAFNPVIGGETQIRWQQLCAQFQVGQLSFDDLARQYDAFYRSRGERDFREVQRDWRRQMQRAEQFLTGIRATAMRATSEEAPAAWVRYRLLTGARQVMPELNHELQLHLMDQGPDRQTKGPYEYDAAVLEKIRQRLAGDAAADAR